MSFTNTQWVSRMFERLVWSVRKHLTGWQPRISVIIPVYNVEDYLDECMESVHQQTLQEIEILCVNDGSLDNSLAILKRHARQDVRVRVITQKNKGLSAARNAGLKRASGQLIMFLDSDDRLERSACERVWTEYQQETYDVLAFGTKFFPEKPAPTPWVRKRLIVKPYRENAFIPEILFAYEGAKPFVWRQAFRRAFLEEHGLLFDETVPFGEDMVFDMEVYPHGERFAAIPDTLYHYRWKRPGSLMSHAYENLDQKIEYHITICERITAYWAQKGWLEAYSVWYVQWLLGFVVPMILKPETQEPAKHLNKLKILIKTYALDSLCYDALSDAKKQQMGEVLRSDMQ